jgi:murein DD-endopeptidase MepM/ murein hydrolase activator NlpD
MTKSIDQDQFDAEGNEVKPEPSITVNEPSNIDQDVQRSLKIVWRLGISVLCLLALSYISQGNTVWSNWIRQYLHTAVNASTGQTFGKLLRSQTVQSIMTNSRNLLRMKTVTPQLRRELSGAFGRGIMANSVWPVQGTLIRRFGWNQPLPGQKPQFSKGIVVAGITGSNVVAIHSGKVVKIDREPYYGWVLEIDHREGWRSVYHNLDQVTIEVNHNVQTGDLLGKLSLSQEPHDRRFWFELYEAGRLIDPLAIIGPG